MEPGVRVWMILKDQVMMEKPIFLSEANRGETHEEALCRMAKKINLNVKPRYEEAQEINRENKTSVSIIASPYACSVVRDFNGVVIYDIEGYSLLFLPESLNDLQIDYLQMRYTNSQDKNLGYYLSNNKFHPFGENLNEKDSKEKLFDIIDEIQKKGMIL